MVAKIIPVESFDLIVFGATGDLACRKIFPALFNRLVVGQMPSNVRVIGVGRKNIGLTSFRALVKSSVTKFATREAASSDWLEVFLNCFSYVALDALSDENWSCLQKLVRSKVPRVFYLSVGPDLFEKIASRVFEFKLISKNSRIVVEKPLGINLSTAKSLNRTLRTYFREDQIYRIDHYLGKETVQNLMALRFSNILFEPIWNSNFIDHVQITVSEEIGVAGRGDYYDRTGALKDMIQNHIMQLLCLTAMEPPSEFSPDSVRDEKLKVIRALSAVSSDHIVKGQYWTNNKENYKIDVNNRKSLTETYVALKVFIKNWRWANTPFYLRTGKKMEKRTSEVAIFFRSIPHSIFGGLSLQNPNALYIRLQPDEGITLKANIKEPGQGGMRLVSVPLDMTFADALGVDNLKQIPDAYERLIMDVIRGDQTLFMRGDEVESAWQWTDQLIKESAFLSKSPEKYAPYSYGPKSASKLIASDGRKWTDI